MKIKKFLHLILFFLLLILYANDSYGYYKNIKLSEKSEITLLTSSPGQELYSVFGHSALRVKDPENSLDRVYNYGTFDFNTPNFYWKFSKGKLDYMLSVSTYYVYERQYRREGRAVYEQVLNLNLNEKQRIFDFLENNALPENRFYRYDFFFDNCATRIRDIVDDFLYVKWYNYPYNIEEKSFRDLLKPYLEYMPWEEFGIDIALGLPSDIIAEPYEYMFLPDEMFIAFAQAKLSDGQPLISEHRVLLEEKLIRERTNPFTPKLVFWIVFVLGIASFLNRKIEKVFDILFFSIISLIGVTIIFLWFISEHEAANANMNLIWTLPTYIYFFAKYHLNSINRITRWYFKIVSFLLILMLIFWQLLPQDLNPAFLPIILLMLIKSAPIAINYTPRRIIKRLF